MAWNEICDTLNIRNHTEFTGDETFSKFLGIFELILIPPQPNGAEFFLVLDLGMVIKIRLKFLNHN
ncbi:MAG TPA: hypothetical protein DCE78_09545 [Bacteroidetes bacterium]|nr:hypothetical protein [Bacteroidota bacterium]